MSFQSIRPAQVYEGRGLGKALQGVWEKRAAIGVTTFMLNLHFCIAQKRSWTVWKGFMKDSDWQP